MAGFKNSPARTSAATLAHGLAHEVAALTDARRRLRRVSGMADLSVLDRMIAERKARVQLLGEKVAGHA